MDAHLHMIRVSLRETDGRLTLRPTNRASKVALMGQPDGREEVLLLPSSVQSIHHIEPRMMGLVNGEVNITTDRGWVYHVHYRAKSAQEVRELLEALRVAGYPVRD